MYNFIFYVTVAFIIILIISNLVKYPLEGIRKFVRGFFIGEHVEELPSEIVNGQQNEPVILTIRNSRKIMKVLAHFLSWLRYFQPGEPINRFAIKGKDQEFKPNKDIRIHSTTFRFRQPAFEIYEKGDLKYWDLLKILRRLTTRFIFWLVILIITGTISGFVLWYLS